MWQAVCWRLEQSVTFTALLIALNLWVFAKFRLAHHFTEKRKNVYLKFTLNEKYKIFNSNMPTDITWQIESCAYKTCLPNAISKLYKGKMTRRARYVSACVWLCVCVYVACISPCTCLPSDECAVSCLHATLSMPRNASNHSQSNTIFVITSVLYFVVVGFHLAT